MLNIPTHSSKTSSFSSAPDNSVQENVAQARALNEVNPEQAQDCGHADLALELNSASVISEPKFSLGQRSLHSTHYVPSAQSAPLLNLIKAQPNTLIEVVGPPRVGKTTLLQRLIDPHRDCFAQYDLLGWIDCSSVSSAHADIQAISYALGYEKLNPQAALRQVANYVKQHPRSLFVLDGLAPSNVDLVLSWLKSSFGSSQLIYTTTQPLADKLGQSLGRPVESLHLSLFTPDEAKQLVQQSLPKESLEKADLDQLVELTGGYPGVIEVLCQRYKTKVVGAQNFSSFLAKSEKHQNVRESLLNEIVQASLAPLEAEAVTDPVAARALHLIKQAAWLGNHRIPFAFFVNEEQPDEVAEEAIDRLFSEQLAILDIDKTTQSLKLNSAFLGAVQKQYASEQRSLLEENIQRLSEVFHYLTDNESAAGRQSKPADLKQYADLVHTLLFETCAKLSLSDSPALLTQVLTLGSSLARLYYLHHGELHLAYDCLQKAKHFFKQGLSKELITHFEQAPEHFTAQSISQDETKLLKLYGQEYLYQAGTLASQLVPRGQVGVEVMQNFEKSYAIQVNLGEAGDPEAIAYTLRNYTRALRKQGRLVDTLEEYEKLQQWMNQHPIVFDERTRAELLVDQGIIQKEVEDAKPEAERTYQEAIETLCETHRIYLAHKTANQHQALGMLSIYVGEVYLAAKQVELGITHTCQILYYDGKRQERQARAYFNLARAFDDTGYKALAKLFIDQAAPLQIKAFHSTTEALRLNIEQKLLQRHQQVKSAPLDAPIANWETQTELTEHVETELVTGSAPSKCLTSEQIQTLEDQAYYWFWQRHSKADLEAQQAQLKQEQVKLRTQEAEVAKKRELQREQDELWYSKLTHQIDLNAEQNRPVRLFAEQFKEKLNYEIVQQLRHANEEAMPMSKADLVNGLVQSLSGALPQIQLDATLSVTATIDIPAIVKGVAQTLTDRQHAKGKAEAQRVADTFATPEEKPKSLQVIERIQQQIEAMGDYAARCWQPVLSDPTWSTKDIQTLAQNGALRLMEYLQAGKVDTLSTQERVVVALMTGTANERLSHAKKVESGRAKGKWSVQGFFTKPGIKIGTEKEGQQLYLPSGQAYPSTYGYRLGSPIEVRNPLYQGAFKSELETQQKAQEARDQQGRCAVM